MVKFEKHKKVCLCIEEIERFKQPRNYKYYK